MLATAALPLMPLLASDKQKPHTFAEPAAVPYSGSDDGLLDEIERTAFEFFWNEAGPSTGQVKDRALVNGNDPGAATQTPINATAATITTANAQPHQTTTRLTPTLFSAR